MSEHLKIAYLDDEGITKLSALEQELGAHIMALEPSINLAALSTAQLEKIQALEAELGVTLLVYEDQTS
ncbi:MAG: hypothetical protein PVG32_21710 [Anaerolineales bacterium]|jgi:alpha-ketoglutarate-dependent taurine dioxygenase